MSSGAWVRTAADALTGLAAAAGAGVGGTWAYFRYRREAPDIPRVNVAVSATLFEHDGKDYVAVDVMLEHLLGGPIRILRDDEYEVSKPVLEIGELRLSGAVGSALDACPVATVEVLRDQEELDAREAVSEHKVIHIGPRHADTIAYEVTLRLLAMWKDKPWTWCTNVIVRVGEPITSTSATVVGTRVS